MNPSSTTLNKAGISAMPLQLQRRTPSLIVPEEWIGFVPNPGGNEKRDQMNPSSTTLNKAGISAMPLQLQRRTPSLIVLIYMCIQVQKYIFNNINFNILMSQ
ncbi:Hypothetical_protein [Hexamita inflata]|uniref:Hypothetical_protein n=1 Tax=Hexamita inflata TaxID=28002 RepID=A0AA86QI86_9EUKA|nr:Hypothetical protein HINF_LOCUS47451 [Hexamita inflata]